jgi:anti-sigma factor RsiW
MQCDETMARLAAYIDQELDVDCSSEVVSHLHRCPRCQAALSELQHVDSRLRGLSRIDLGSDFSGRLARLVREEHESSERVVLRGGRPAARWGPGLFDGLRALLGIVAHSEDDPLDEFNDFPPLSIGSAYFSIWGQPQPGPGFPLE